MWWVRGELRSGPEVGARADGCDAGYSIPRRSGVVPRCGPASTSIYWRSPPAAHPWISPSGPAYGGSETLTSRRSVPCSSGDVGSVSTSQQIVPAISVAPRSGASEPRWRGSCAWAVETGWPQLTRPDLGGVIHIGIRPAVLRRHAIRYSSVRVACCLRRRSI